MELNLYPRKLEFYTKCIRYFQNGHHIQNYNMDREEARDIYNKYLRNEAPVKKLHFCNFLNDLKRVKALKRRRDNVVMFKKEVLDAIISDPSYVITKRQSKKIVSQNFAFKERKEISKVDKTNGQTNSVVNNKNLNLLVEVKSGSGNCDEHVFCTGNMQISVKNISLDPIHRISFEPLLPVHSVKIENSIFLGDLLPTKSFSINLKTNIPASSTLHYPIYFKYTQNEKELEQIKILYLNNFPTEFKQFLQALPYKRNAPIIKEYDFMVVPGEKPPAVTGFQPLVPLNRYTLNKDFIAVINAGLKIDDVSEELRSMCKSIIDTLNVPKPEDPLTPGNYCKILTLLLKLEEHQMQIDIRSYDMNDAKMKKVGKLYKLKVPGLSENRPSLIVGDYLDVNDVATKTKYRGFVHKKELDEVLVSMSKSFSENVFVDNRSFDISFGYNRTTIKLEHRAVRYIGNSKIEKHFFPTAVPNNKFTNLSLKWERMHFELNAQQKNAVMHILNKTSYPFPYIIFGPPGTGKTVTVVEAINQIYKTMPDKKILVCTPSNNAANVINVRLSNLPQRHLLRYISYSFPYNEINKEILIYCNYNDREYFHPKVDDILNYRIVITTLTNAGRLLSLGVPVHHFDYIFIDESGHATETETLIPLAGLFCDKTIPGEITGQIVLAGDPEQLGPIIHSTIAAKYGFGTSMLERLMKTVDIYKRNDGNYNSDVITKLLENYRSHETILSIPNEKFYDKELIAKADEMSRVALNSEILINKNFPMIFHSVEGQDIREQSSPSFFNLAECYEVMVFLEKLVGNKMSGMKIQPKHIGIITPYRQQVKKIKMLCKEKKYDGLTVGSVEQFQGQERMIIIISTVRSSVQHIEHDQKFHLGFLKNRKRFNVAITRAKALVIVVGNPNLLQYDEYWRAYIQTCVDNRSISGKPFTLKTDEKLAKDDSFILISSMKTLQINDDSNPGFRRGDI